ncbi:hypothetical protein DDB_G0288159 [Dictyostelium discoideum AX4]|uniref:Uncharacterized protein n=1 Tax=Dictyostelium discoideum TaxID=44689 RepID=Q54JB9_DICDI|nr:hypothetical protein DDB_G0288159 [Dictyostelium discoideum AX4]EAL63367.1 hypothetical protein DDB_G0288159 [Dictyostelium discoideum AX4]|eukprot:XP_636874.1 hypothetical protein DDB_G0288159 [Dictyostelium discoideum AX4]
MRRTYAGPSSSNGKYTPKLDPGKNLPTSNSGSNPNYFSQSKGQEENKN